MKVNEYIYHNWANWNFAILKQLCEDEGIEWSEELVAYLKTTPTNTNWSMLVNFGIDPYGCDEGGEKESTIKICFTKTEGDNLHNAIVNGEVESVKFTIPVGVFQDAETGEYRFFIDDEISPSDTPHSASITHKIEDIDADTAINLIETNGCTDITIYWK